MEENKFEKDIRRKMEGMKIDPSDKVWEKVVKRIPEKKKYRMVPFYFLLLTLILISGGLWLWNSPKRNEKKAIAFTESNSQATSPQKGKMDNNKTAPSSGGSKENETNKSADTHAETKVLLTPASGRPTPLNRQKNNGDDTALKRKERKTTEVKVLSDLSEMRKNTKKDSSQILLSEIKKGDTGKEIVRETEKQGKMKSMAPVQVQNHTENPATSHNDSLAQTIVGNHSPEKRGEIKKKWHWNINISAGRSQMWNSFFDLEEKSNNYYSPGMGTPGNNNQFNPTPSKPKGGFAFTIGASVERDISRRSQISFGLNYKYYSTTNKVGERISSANQLSYSNTYSNENFHRNSFHYAEIPVILDMRLTSRNKLPLYWEAGIHISQLLASDALQFETDRYYQDNSLLHKTQMGLSTGFFVTLFSQNHFPVSIGPYIYYAASSIASKGLYRGRHFSFLGIQASLNFSKRK